MASLTPLQLIAGAALSNNTGIAINSTLNNEIANYRSTDLIAPFASTLGNSQINTILGNLVPTLETLSATNCPALSDSTPAAYASALGVFLTGSAADGNSISGFTNIIKQFGNLYLGSGDDSVFAQVFTAADGYVTSTNQYILTADNSNSYLGSSFTSMNSLITGDLDQVNLAFSSFGNDLKNLGLAIGLENLDQLGSPLALFQQILNVAGLTPRLAAELDRLAIDSGDILTPPDELSQRLRLEKNLYQVFSTISGRDLGEILQLLGTTTANIQVLSDLLNPVKIFPNSFFSLTVRTVDGLRGIYLDTGGSVNFKLLSSLPDYVIAEYRRLSQAIPQDQALANQCLRVALQQIKNIFNLSLPVLAESYLNLVTTRNLPLINALTEPVPQSVIDFYSSAFATGSGPQGTLVLTDLLGAAVGVDYIDRIQNTVAVLDSLVSESNFANLIVVYQRMNTTIAGGYGDAVLGPITIPAGPAAGTYTAVGNLTAAGNAFGNALIPNAQTFITSVVTNNATAVATLNTNWVSMAEKLVSENNNLANAAVVIDELIPNQRTAILGFVQNLPTYGLDTSVNGTAEFLEKIADTDTIGGQAIVGALRQGRNVAVLDTAGIGINIEIPSTLQQPPPQVSTDRAEYTESEAANLVIR